MPGALLVVIRLVLLAAVSLSFGWLVQAAEASPWTVRFLDDDADRVYYYRAVAPDELKFEVGGLPAGMSLLVRFGYLDGAAFVPNDAFITKDRFQSYKACSGDSYTFQLFVQCSGDNQNRPVAFEVGYIAASKYCPLGSMLLTDGVSKVYVNIKPPAEFLEKGSQTTDFAQKDFDFTSINDLTFHRPDMSMVRFEDTVNLMPDIEKLSVLDVYTDMGQTGKVGLDTEGLQSLAGKPAAVTMYGLPFTVTPDIFVYDGNHQLIDGTGIVSNKSYNTSTGELSFNVSHFTAFEAAVLTGLELSPGSSTIRVGDKTELNATEVYSNGQLLPLDDVFWSSSDDSVAVVDGDGVVTGVAQGACIITAVKGEATGSATVTVTPAELKQITVSPSEAVVTAGEARQLTASGEYSNGQVLALSDVVWTSSDDSVAVVDGNGVVTGVARGVCTVTASKDGVTAGAVVTVKPAEPEPVLTGLVITPGSATVQVGSTERFSVTGVYGDGSTADVANALWSSSDPSVATVDATGLVLGLTPGECVIKASFEGIESEAPVTVVENAGGNGGSRYGDVKQEEDRQRDVKQECGEEFPCFYEYIDWPGRNWLESFYFALGKKWHN